MRLDGIEPGTFYGKQAGNDADALALLLDGAVVSANPPPDRLAGMPRGVVPHQQPGLRPQRGELIAAPRQKLGRQPTDRLASGKAEPDLLHDGGCCPQQHAVARQRLRVGIVRADGLLTQAQRVRRCGPALQVRLGQAAPPDLIGEPEHPVGLRCR